jgi:Holliday junction resolvase
MHFFIPLKKIPTVTAQQQKLAIWGGKPHTFKDAELAAVEDLFMSHLAKQAPEKPYRGPIQLTTSWLFGYKDAIPGIFVEVVEIDDPEHVFKTTRPDTDNLLKMFKDCMTKTGFWKDDAQVCDERTIKRYSRLYRGVKASEP